MTVTENLGLCPAVESSMNVISRQFTELDRLSRQLSGEAEGGGKDSDLFPPKPGGSKRDSKVLADAIREAQEIAAALEKSLETFAGIEGTRAQAILGSEHQQLVNKYQDANPAAKSWRFRSRLLKFAFRASFRNRMCVYP